MHVVSNEKFAKKAEACGVDAIVAEGFEAGGHNGREETTTLCLIPQIVNAVKIPVIAAGGIGSGLKVYIYTRPLSEIGLIIGLLNVITCPPAFLLLGKLVSLTAVTIVPGWINLPSILKFGYNSGLGVVLNPEKLPFESRII